MRVLLATLLLAAAPGCLGVRCHDPANVGKDCSYGVGGVVAVARFTDEAWNATLLRDAFEGMGFPLEPSAPEVVATGTRDGERAHARVEPNGTILLSFEFLPQDLDLGYTREEAQAILDGLRQDAEPRAARHLADLEARTGWRHDGDVEWLTAMSVA